MRCPNGTRKNKDGECVPKAERKRCPNGTRKNKDGECVPNTERKRCPNGTRKNKDGECVPKVARAATPRAATPRAATPRAATPRVSTPRVSTPRVSPNELLDLKKIVSRIERFMNRTKNKRREMYLKAICSEAGLCIAFGIEALKIKEFFRNFSFDLVDQVKRIGAPSANGFVNEVRFAKRGYNAYAVLKSTNDSDTDNLMYEYRVGQFLNKMSFLFPCFLETYGLFKYKDNEKWEHFETTQQINPDVFRKSLDPQPFDLAVGCDKSKHMAVLIQHIRGCKSVNEMLSSGKFQHILPVLFQVYYPLFHMRKNFTHYDLHTENVVLYEPVSGKYIQFHYHTATGVISFKSPYIAKIIDYGRSYINDGETSKDIYDQVCKLKNCDPNCGVDKGFSMFELSNEEDFYHIVTQKKNESHDLRFLNMILDEVKTMPTPVWFKEYMDSFKLVYDEPYGTVEKSCPDKICDVEGLYRHLEHVLPLSNVQLDGYHTVKYGDLHIYSDKPLEFRKV